MTIAAPPPPPSGFLATPGPDAPWFRDLNPAQREAVETIDGPVLLLAGAGTGKTRALTARLANILSRGQVRPWQILAVTFTNKAAREMRERVATLIGPVAQEIWLGTFHALGARILRRHAELAGLRGDFTILDADDQLRLLKQILDAENVDDRRWPPRLMMHAIQRWKDRALTPDRVGPAEAGQLAGGKAARIYSLYQERLRILNAADFGDLILHCVTLLTAHDDVLERYRQRFHHIMVDEYQDTNVAQYLWLRLLAKGHGNICCVGDDDQSIYGWRGAEVGNILRFERDFPGAAIIRLEKNYRSTAHILGAASGLIARNQGRLGKTLWTDRSGGDKVILQGVWDGAEEARTVCARLEALMEQGTSLSGTAVLVRAGFQTREFEERLMTLGLPYRVVGGARFYEREEIRDAIAYLRIVRQPSDDLALERIINKPARGIGKTTLQAMHDLARRESRPLFDAARGLLDDPAMKPAARRSLAAIMDDFSRWRDLATKQDHLQLAATVLDESGYTGFWRQSKKPEAPGKLENLKELLTAMEAFENLEEFLEHVSLVMENEERAENAEAGFVSLMTLHAAKGLEFDTVFLPGWEEGLFPHQRAMDENGLAGLEEERRLAYVGMTRARRELHILFAANRRMYGRWQSALPSRFLDELPKQHLDIRTDRGLYGGSGGGRAEDRAASSFSSLAAQQPGNSRSFAAPRREPSGAAARQHQTVAASGFQPGDFCTHRVFGRGRITAADGASLTIEFDSAGRKKVMADYVEHAS